MAEGSFSGGGLDAGADVVVFVGWALLAVVGAEEDIPSGEAGTARIDGSAFGEGRIGNVGFGDGIYRVPEGTIGGMEGGGRSSPSYISAIILERPTIAAG